MTVVDAPYVSAGALCTQCPPTEAENCVLCAVCATKKRGRAVERVSRFPLLVGKAEKREEEDRQLSGEQTSTAIASHIHEQYTAWIEHSSSDNAWRFAPSL